MCRISSLMAAAEGHVAEFSSFANFEEKKRKSNVLIGNQMGSFGQIRKKFIILLLSADSRYFRIYALEAVPLFSVWSISLCQIYVSVDHFSYTLSSTDLSFCLPLEVFNTH